MNNLQLNYALTQLNNLKNREQKFIKGNYLEIVDTKDHPTKCLQNLFRNVSWNSTLITETPFTLERADPYQT